jgi:hypothetical protein
MTTIMFFKYLVTKFKHRSTYIQGDSKISLKKNPVIGDDEKS